MSEQSQTKPAPKVNQELQAQYNAFKSTLTQLQTKVAELETQSDEHELVIKTLKDVEDSRKCFRMIGGVLVELTVGDVLPQLETNQQGLKSVLDTLMKDYKKTQDDMDAWQKKNKVQVVRTD